MLGAASTVITVVESAVLQTPAVLREAHTNGAIHPLKTLGLLHPNGTVKIEAGRSRGGIFTHFVLCLLLCDAFP